MINNNLTFLNDRIADFISTRDSLRQTLYLFLDNAFQFAYINQNDLLDFRKVPLSDIPVIKNPHQPDTYTTVYRFYRKNLVLYLECSGQIRFALNSISMEDLLALCQFVIKRLDEYPQEKVNKLFEKPGIYTL